MNAVICRFAVASVLVTGVGCGAEAPPSSGAPAASADHLLASVEMSAGNVVEFYEPIPGHILISETAPAANQPILQHDELNKLSAVEVFRKLSPQAAVPNALVTAETRAQLLPKSPPAAAAPSSDGTTLQPSHARIAPHALSSNAVWFQNKFCAAGGHSRDWCLLDWWNGAWEAGNNYGETYAVIYADTGNLIFSYSGDYSGTYVVGQGYWRSFYAKAGIFSSVSERYDILNASDKRFDFAGYFN